MATILLVVGLLLFLGLVVLHEFGHFIMARRGGVEVEEFGIGFPPHLLRRRTKGGWFFSLNLLPLGGFVKLKGEHDTDKEAGSFGAASLAVKTKIMLAGVGMNVAVAYLLLVILALIGMPQLITNQFIIKQDATYLEHAQTFVAADVVEPHSPAGQAGIKSNDAIVAIGQPTHLSAVTNPDTLPQLTHQLAGQTVTLEYRQGNNGPLVQKIVTLRTAHAVATAQAQGKQIGYLGVSVYQTQQGMNVVRSTWSAPVVAAGVIKQYTVLTLEGLGKALAGLGSIIAGEVTGNSHARQAGQTRASSQVVGPVGIFFIFKYGSLLGYRFIIMLVAVLSLVLAIMNVLPIPALDGGRLWLILGTRALKRPLSARYEELVNAAGFAALMGLVILITIADVKRFF